MLGTVFAAVGHHAVAEGAVPWRLVGVAIVAQFAAVWPLARRHYTPTATIAFTLATQGVLHLALSSADGDPPAVAPWHATHAGHLAAAAGDGHVWHHAGAAMTTVHAVTALVMALLLNRADARMSAALGTLRTLAGAVGTALAQVLSRPVAGTGPLLPTLPGRRPGAFFEVALRAREEALEHVVVRRGPPRRGRPRASRSRCLRDRFFPYQQGVPLCPCPRTCWPLPAVVSLSPVPPR
ncbi:hypothetical protein [Streptomyces spongiae]|uniref:hypothetical protein n=1 Tax=Streptomyces spongiae TaxID=565072 RepID=UPI00128C4361|nr:hypothetical protein [Streptomyces spongiae]